MPEIDNVFVTGMTVEPVERMSVAEAIEEAKEIHPLEAMTAAAKKAAEENEDIAHLREIQESEVEETGLVEGEATFRVKEDGKPDFTKPIAGDGELKEADLALDELDQLEERNKKILSESAEKTADAYGLTDEEATNIAEILILYKNNKKMNVYANMIPSMKQRVTKICMESNIPLSQVNMVAKYMMDQFLSTASEDEEFIDIEKTIERSMKIPSMVDIYMEHINDTMDVKLPAMAEAMKEREPEKAETLLKIKDEYTAAFLCSRLREMYDTNTRLRKLVRRDYSDKDVRSLAQEVNYFNQKTQFKMPDCTVIPNILREIAKQRGVDMGDLINKFCVLLFGAASYIDLEELTDAAFYYYSIKNISMMTYLGDKLSDFSAELISNIFITMLYIYRREEEFYVQNNSKQSGKRGSNQRYGLYCGA